jgi:N utilization substance protein B
MKLLLNESEECITFPTEDQSPIDSQNLPRRDQRSLIFFLLYALDAFDYQTSLESAADNFSRGFGYIISPNHFIFNHAAQVTHLRNELDEELRPLLAHWRLERLSTCTRLIMRLGLWELKYTQTDPSVIINEAVELAKCFAETDAYRFVNGVLDEWAKKTAPTSENLDQSA